MEPFLPGHLLQSSRNFLARWARIRSPAMVLAALALASPVRAQSGWTVTLFIDPFPSPYLADWEINPNISTLTLINGTGQPQTAAAVYRVTNSAGRILASGRSDPQTVPPDVPAIYTSFVDIAGTSSHDVATEDQMVRTGRLPEGEYRACVTIADGNSFVVGEACADFTILYPDPPLLIAPGNGDIVTTTAPFLQWTPLHVPSQFQLRYILQVVEVGPNQLPDEALNGPVPHYVNPDVGTTNLQYPLDAQPLVEGRTYAWRVVTLDHNGYAATSNGGASETYVFRYDPGNMPSPGQSAITLSMTNAFDHDPDDGAGGTTTSSGPDRGIDQLCLSWSNPASNFVLSTDSPIGFRRFAGSPAQLFQSDSTKQWWIATKSPNGKRDVLIGGGCDRFTDETLIHWIASKNETLQQRIGEFLSNPIIQALPIPKVEGVEFATIVLSKGSHTVSVPQDFTAGVEFLGWSTAPNSGQKQVGELRELEVATGLNMFSELDLETFALWPFFEAIGFKEKRLSLYGFLGWDASWSVGGTIGSGGAQGDLSTEHKFLVISATLPQREPVGPLEGWVKSMGFELEVSLGDSTGRAWSDKSGRFPDVSASLELIPKIIHRIEVNDRLTLEGSIGLDFARETDRGLPMEALNRLAFAVGLGDSVPAPEYGVDVIISYGATTNLPLGRRGNVRIEELAVDVKFPLDAPGSEQQIMLSGELGVGNQDGLGKIGVSFHRTNLAALHKSLGDARKARYEAGTKLTAAETGECVASATMSAAKTKWCAIDKSAKELEKKLAKFEAGPEGKNAKKTSDWEWRLRASVGHMSLGQLLSLIREGS